MKILHVLLAGTIGGIERLCLDFIKGDNEQGVVFAKDGGEFVNQYKEASDNIYIFGKNEKLNFIRIFKFTNYIVGIIRRYGYRAVIFHNGSPILWWIARRIKICCKACKVFIYAHSDISDFLLEKRNGIDRCIYKFIYLKSAKIVDGLIAISESVKDGIICRYPFLEKKTFINYNGIDCCKFSNGTEKRVYDKIKLVYVGRLIEQKGVQNILRALADCNDIEYSFDVIGDGNYRSELEILSCKLNINEKVHFLGKKQNIEELLKGYNFFIHLPEWEEGFGITVAEALSSGLICIVNDKGALPELVKDGYNGFIFHSSREYDLKKLFTDINSCKFNLVQMSENAKDSAKKFDVSQCVCNLKEIVGIE